MSRLDLPPRPRILVIVLRRIGDVLLATPLIRSLRRAWPDAVIDALVFAGTDGILAGNPDLDAIVRMPPRPRIGDTLATARSLFRRYDLAISTQTGDRPTALALAAAPIRVGFLDDRVPGSWWKRAATTHRVPVEPANHRVVELLRLADAIGVARVPDVVCPRGDGPIDVPRAPYAVLHANPKFQYRRWTDEGWRTLADRLAARGFALVATGGPDADERAYLDRLWAGHTATVARLDGALDWGGLTALLRDASVYVGPDTSMTHLAAAAGTPTVAIYGPASPSEIGPWPVGGPERPWDRAGTIQRRRNVWVVQNPLPCMPCDKVGCENRLDSYSRCLDELDVATVTAAVEHALASRPAVSSIAG